MQLGSSSLVILALLSGCGGAQGSARSVDAIRGPWTMMRFAGGPPRDGQVTDTLHVDPSVGRSARIERTEAGIEGTKSCEALVADDAAWNALVDAMADDDLQAALGHPKDLPGLVVDGGYFTCNHAGVDIAVSSLSMTDAPALRALRKLQSAYDGVRSQLLASPSCAALRSAH